MMVARAAALLTLLAVAACQTPQDFGGVTKLDYNPETGALSYVGGKEFAGLEADVEKNPDGTFKVKVVVGEAKAFEGQNIQAQRISEQTAMIMAVLGQVLPQMVQAALCGAGFLQACAPISAPINPGAPQ